MLLSETPPTRDQRLALKQALHQRLLPILWLVITLVSLSAPTAYLLLRLQDQQRRAQQIATQVASLLKQEVLLRPTLWKYDTLKILRHLRSLYPPKEIPQLQIVDQHKRRLTPSPTSTQAVRLLWGTAPLEGSGTQLGSVWIGLDPTPIRRRALALFGLFFALAVLLAALIYLFPMHTTHHAEAQIITLFTQLKREEQKLATLNQELEAQVEARSRELSKAYAALQEKEARLRQLASQAISLQEAERREIARELHDSAGQALTAIRIHLQLLTTQIPKDSESSTLLHNTIEMTDQTLQEVRRAVMMLGPSVLDDFGLCVALQRACEDFQERTKIHIDRQLDDALPPLPAGIESACYRIAQEALTNITRHAHTSYVALALHAKDDHIELIIEDDGVGFVPEKLDLTASRGLRGIQERVTLLAGTYTLTSSPNHGTKWHISLPITAPDQRKEGDGSNRVYFG